MMEKSPSTIITTLLELDLRFILVVLYHSILQISIGQFQTVQGASLGSDYFLTEKLEEILGGPPLLIYPYASLGLQKYCSNLSIVEDKHHPIVYFTL